MLASVKGELWMMNSDRIEEFALSCLDASEKAGTQAEGFDVSDFYPMRQDAYMDASKVAHIQVKGSLLNKAPAIYQKLGLATIYQTIVDETRAAEANGAIGIVYHVDSPGGTVSGVKEAGRAIAGAGIPTVAHCSNMACSAAYWLASQSDFIVAEESAEIGNIGAILSWADCSTMWEKMGVEFKALVSEGADLKSTFHTEPDDAQIEFLQDRINKAGAEFREAVKAGRSKAGAELDDEVWRAGWYSGDDASNLGLSDDVGGLVAAINSVIELIEK